MADLLLYQLPTFSLGFIIGLLIEILISSVILYLSVKLVGGYANFNKSILLAAIMEVLNLVVFPILLNYLGALPMAILGFILYYGLWLFLVMNFFKVSFWKAILIAIVQVIVTIVLGILGLMAIIGAAFGALLLLK